jgi:hypothetical protein
MLSRLKPALFLPLFALCVAMFVGPFFQFNFFRMLPGDLGDSRLNNYFLENTYLFLIGKSSSLWHLNFFYPFPYVLGFSDNLFGSFPIYFLGRIFFESDVAFQFWYLSSYCVNYFCAYFVFRKLGFKQSSSIVGALIFSFALPVSAQTSHVQLAYRFCIPLSFYFLISFLVGKSIKDLLLSMVFLVWQFYCTIYIGFFLLLAEGLFFIVYFLSDAKQNGLNAIIKQYMTSLRYVGFKYFLFFLILFLFICLLFYPYLMVNQIYDIKRSSNEIASMLPRAVSYLLADDSRLWGSISASFVMGSMRHEQQLFFGLIPLILFGYGLYLSLKDGRNLIVKSIGITFLVLFLMSLSIKDVSAWLYLNNLPLFSAIRAVSRISLVMLFFIGCLAAVAIDRIIRNSNSIIYVILILMIVEFSLVKVNKSPISEWRSRITLYQSKLPTELPADPVLIFAQRGSQFNVVEEIDAMWIALIKGYSTMNGYSGFSPQAYGGSYGDKCVNIQERIDSYLKVVKSADLEKVKEDLTHRLVPIDFRDCKYPVKLPQ